MEYSKKREVARLFQDVNHKFKNNMRKMFEDKGITMPQGMVVGMLLGHGEMKISELSNKIGLSNSTVSGIIDRLEKHKVVERIRSQDDKRIVYVKLTQKFAEAHKDFDKEAEEYFATMLDKATEEDIEIIMKGLNTLNEVLGTTEKIGCKKCQ